MNAGETTVGVPTPESVLAALTMWQGQVPCFFQMAEPPCMETAVALVHWEHEETAPPDCRGPERMPWPVCDDHLRVLRQHSHPFWRTFYNQPAFGCWECGVPLRVNRIEMLGG